LSPKVMIGTQPVGLEELARLLLDAPFGAIVGGVERPPP
jgi:hypothetical protein